MARSPFMVETAYNVLSDVFAQWHKEPYRWMRERDLQAEIGGRLTQIFSMQGLGNVTGNYGWVADGFSPIQTWARVSFEPYVPYTLDGKQHRCHPDIVIWKDFDETPDYAKGEGWPILWACELKYGSVDSGTWDEQKLELLLDQERIEYGCAIRVHYTHDPNGVGRVWNTRKHGHRLWVCDVSAPKPDVDR